MVKCIEEIIEIVATYFITNHPVRIVIYQTVKQLMDKFYISGYVHKRKQHEVFRPIMK